MLNVHEQELVKWTTGDDEKKHFSGAAAWDFEQRRGTWRASSSSTVKWVKETLSVLCPDFLGLFYQSCPLLTSVCFSC